MLVVLSQIVNNQNIVIIETSQDKETETQTVFLFVVNGILISRFKSSGMLCCILL